MSMRDLVGGWQSCATSRTGAGMKKPAQGGLDSALTVLAIDPFAMGLYAHKPSQSIARL